MIIKKVWVLYIYIIKSGIKVSGVIHYTDLAGIKIRNCWSVIVKEVKMSELVWGFLCGQVIQYHMVIKDT